MLVCLSSACSDAKGPADRGDRQRPADPAQKSSSLEAKPPQAQPKSAAPIQSVRTSKGTFSVPGKAFADGRDLVASPRLTLMNINVWDGVPRRQRVCQVAHGDQLELLDAKQSVEEGRYYVEVKSGACQGWLSENFLSTKRQAPVGDKM